MRYKVDCGGSNTCGQLFYALSLHRYSTLPFHFMMAQRYSVEYLSTRVSSRKWYTNTFLFLNYNLIEYFFLKLFVTALLFFLSRCNRRLSYFHFLCCENFTYIMSSFLLVEYLCHVFCLSRFYYESKSCRRQSWTVKEPLTQGYCNTSERVRA